MKNTPFCPYNLTFSLRQENELIWVFTIKQAHAYYFQSRKEAEDFAMFFLLDMLLPKGEGLDMRINPIRTSVETDKEGGLGKKRVFQMECKGIKYKAHVYTCLAGHKIDEGQLLEIVEQSKSPLMQIDQKSYWATYDLIDKAFAEALDKKKK